MRYLHILAGLVAIGSGAVALYVLKGGALHRRSGMIFVYAMLFMASSGATMALLKTQRVNFMAGLLTCYLVLTAWLTVRRPAARSRAIDVAAMMVAALGGLAALGLGIHIAGSPTGKMDGMSGAPAIVFGIVALLGALGDARMLSRGLPGSRRIGRHVWRMCTGLFIAAGSFFLGQAQVFPAAIRASGVLAVPVLLVIVLMVFWMARVRFTPRYRAA